LTIALTPNLARDRATRQSIEHTGIWGRHVIVLIFWLYCCISDAPADKNHMEQNHMMHKLNHTTVETWVASRIASTQVNAHWHLDPSWIIVKILHVELWEIVVLVHQQIAKVLQV